MANAKTPALQAYDRVILRAKSVYKEKHGTDFGAMQWFASEIGVTRQTLANWGKRAGILPSYVDRVAKLTGLKKIEVRPETMLFEATTEDWTALCKGRSKDLIERITMHDLRGKYG
jgi:hypothetical protein